MKNIMSYLIIVFSLLTFSLAQARESCESRAIKLSQLKYIGEDLTKLLPNPGDCFVVEAKNQVQAFARCNPNWKKLGDTVEKNVLNPGNPQYLDSDKEGNPNYKHGDRDRNSLGYWFCVNMDKRDMCTRRSSALEAEMNVTWKQAEKRFSINKNNEGDCQCQKKGSNSNPIVQCPASEEKLNALGKESAPDCPANSKPKTGETTGQCQCLFGDKRDITSATAKINPCSEKDEPNTEVEKDLQACFSSIEQSKKACSEAGQQAIDKCNKETAPKANKNIEEAQRVMSIGLDALIAKNAGTGALESCAMMSATGTGLIEALSLFRDNCNKELKNCKSGCEAAQAYIEEKPEAQLEACQKILAESNPPKLWTEAHTQRFNTMNETYRKATDGADKLCKGDAQGNNVDLDNALRELGESVQKADICKCQLTTSSVNTGTNADDKCENVMQPLTCMQNLNQPGCSFSSVGCQPGSTVAGCRNPVVAINPGGSGIGMPASGFAGPGFSSGGGTATGKVNVGDGDFSGLFDETRPAASATQAADNGSPFGSAGGSGSLGGGGGGGGGEGTAGGGGGGEGNEKSGLSGFFNNAKGAVMSMFGNGAGDKGNTTKKPNSKSFKNDVNGFRPKGAVRGMANASEVGGKNRDIWKTMNERYTDQYHTFITVESPSK